MGSDLLLPLMLMGGNGMAQGAGMMNNPLMMMLLLGDGGLGGLSGDDMLLPLMLMGGMGGDAGGMNSLLPLLLLGEGSYTIADKIALDAICAKVTDVAKNAQCATDAAAYLTAATACVAETDAAAKKVCET